MAKVQSGIQGVGSSKNARSWSDLPKYGNLWKMLAPNKTSQWSLSHHLICSKRPIPICFNGTGPSAIGPYAATCIPA